MVNKMFRSNDRGTAPGCSHLTPYTPSQDLQDVHMVHKMFRSSDRGTDPGYSHLTPPTHPQDLHPVSTQLGTSTTHDFNALQTWLPT